MESPFSDAKIFVAGHRGMVGSAIVRLLKKRGHKNLLLRTRDELDLLDQKAVMDFFESERPAIVVLAAAKVGGIEANRSAPAEFLFENMVLSANVIHAADRSGVERLLFLGSSCIYPKNAPQSISEDALLTGALEPTNEAYAIAKISGLKLCQFYRQQYGRLFHSAMPCNLYGPSDNYDPELSHVIPGLIRRFHEAKVKGADSVTIWGTGEPRREFLHVDDLARACLHLLAMDNPPDWTNIGFGEDVTVMDLATQISAVVGFTGKIITDPTKPNGTMQKLMDSSRIRQTGWNPEIELGDGLKSAYEAFLDQL